MSSPKFRLFLIFRYSQDCKMFINHEATLEIKFLVLDIKFPFTFANQTCINPLMPGGSKKVTHT